MEKRVIKESPHIGYGYAVTSRSSKEQTANTVPVHVDTEQAPETLVNRRLAYVAVSRDRCGQHIYTNGKGHLTEQLARYTSHQTATEPRRAQ